MSDASPLHIIEEYKPGTIPGLLEQEVSYLRKDCFKSNSENPPFKIRELKDNIVEIENTSFSGVIHLEKNRIHFSTKVKTNLFYMLSFLKDEQSFLYDKDKLIDIEEGANFFDILGRLFLNELEDIFKRGLSKKYIRKSENIAFLKGKLLIKNQINNHIRGTPKFYCSYDDLTFDNLENQIILRAITLLIPLIRFNEVIQKDLSRYCLQLKELISLKNVVPEDCERVQYSKLNEHYETIILFSKIILQYYFIRSVYEGASIGFNFIVNMNKVYEDFVTELVEEVIRENDRFKNYEVERQEKFDSLVREKKIITRPDLILRERETNNYPIIIDAKYKRQANNADYYQVIAYALAIPTAKACCLIYPEDEKGENQILTLDTTPFNFEGRQIPIHTLTINLYLDEKSETMGFLKYIGEIKSQLKNKLITIF